MTLPESVGRYRILGPLGHGAMGVVLRAHDPQLERDVARNLVQLSADGSRTAFVRVRVLGTELEEIE